MIAVDTTVLIDEFRAGGDIHASVNRTLLSCGAEEMIVPISAAAEFMEGGVLISEERFQQCCTILRSRTVVSADWHAAEHYARITASVIFTASSAN